MASFAVSPMPPNTDLFFKTEFRIPAGQDNEVETSSLGTSLAHQQACPQTASHVVITSSVQFSTCARTECSDFYYWQRLVVNIQRGAKQ